MKAGVAAAYLRSSDRSVIGVDGQGRIGFANPAAGRLLGIEPDDLVGRPFQDWVVDCDDLLGVGPQSSGTETGPGAPPDPSIRLAQRADGTAVTLAIRAIPLGDEGPLPLALELEARDASPTQAVTNQRLVEIIERTPNPIGLADPRGTVLYLNPGFWAFVGLDPGEFRSFRHLRDFHPPWAVSRLEQEGLPEARKEGFWEGETALWNAAGEEAPVLQTIHAHYGPDGSVAFYSTIFRDIGVLRDRERKLQDFYRILDNVGAYIYCKDAHLRYTYANAHTCALFGCSPEEVVGRTDDAFFGETAQRMVDEADKVTLAEGRATHREKRVYVKSRGEYRSFLAVKNPLWDDQGQIRGLYGVATDITEQKDREAKLTHRANYDPLTQVLNRSAAEAVLERHMKLADRYGRPVSVILVDVDHFKDFNDRLGHEGGDRVLVQLTATLGAHLREADFLARWGGEEFLVGVPETERDGACELAERLRRAAEQEVVPEAPPGSGTLSAGVAQYQPGESLRSWIRRADHALYEAKNAGRNRIRWSD